MTKILLSIVCMMGLAFAACEGPTGPEGEQGIQGEKGMIGPAGEDGSKMYAGVGAPAEEMGEIGDYYLNSRTGELYGPKSEKGWGGPIIVLVGEDGEDGKDGEDGEDGKDGEDGEDGSQIYSGDGAPNESLGQIGDFYLDKTNYDLYGPKTSSGWGSPVNLKGAKGNANVTRYIFPGLRLSAPEGKLESFVVIPGIESEQEMRESIWLSYLVNEGSYFSIPGFGREGRSQYRTFYNYRSNSESVYFYINLREGIGEIYDKIEIVRIESSSTVDLSKIKTEGAKAILPDHLDISNYEEVAKYYGFWNGGYQ